MLFQGQELLEDEWFRDEVPLDWTRADTYAGVLRLYRDLVHLRRDRHGTTRGLRGRHVRVHHVNDDDNVIAWHRWDAGGPGDDVVVLANVSDRAWADYRIGLPRPGRWRVRLNSDWRGYGDDHADHGGHDVDTADQPRDGMAQSAAVGVGRYSVLVLSQDRPPAGHE
jgi:1,4-alpha-glucan branching enzyme